MKKKETYLSIIIMTIFLNACMLYFFVYVPEKDAFSVQSETTNQTLKQTMKNSSYDAVVLEVENAQQSVALLAGGNQQEDIRYKFKDAIILGDSITEGLTDYGLMDMKNCVGIRGARTNNMMDTYHTLAVRKPKTVFLEYGMNDLGYFRGNAKMYAKHYEEVITMIQKDLPEAAIYVNAILPIAPYAIEKNPVYAAYKDYNKALKALCKKLDVTYIDNDFIIEQQEDPYEFDGVHPKYPFYSLWLKNMAKEAGL